MEPNVGKGHGPFFWVGRKRPPSYPPFRIANSPATFGEPGLASLLKRCGKRKRSIDSWVPLGRGPGVFWRAGRRPAWTRAPRSGGSHRVMPEIHSPVKSLITPRMQDGVRGTSSRCGDGFAKQVAGNVEK